MLHNEARKLLVEGYEATHNAEAIANIFPRQQVHRLPFGRAEAENRKR